MMSDDGVCVRKVEGRVERRAGGEGGGRVGEGEGRVGEGGGGVGGGWGGLGGLDGPSKTNFSKMKKSKIKKTKKIN